MLHLGRLTGKIIFFIILDLWQLEKQNKEKNRKRQKRNQRRTKWERRNDLIFPTLQVRKDFRRCSVKKVLLKISQMLIKKPEA